jgi:hypothetical protein
VQRFFNRSQSADEQATNNPHPPGRGQVLRDYSLLKTDGTPLLLSDFRGKQNLLLIFLVGSEPTSISGAQAQLLQALSEKSGEVRELETRVIVVVRPEQLPTVAALSAELVVAVDPSGTVFSDVGAEPDTTIYITDKFREVFHVYRIAEGASLPSASELVGWIEFVAMNCPECHPPEWPADAV